MMKRHLWCLIGVGLVVLIGEAVRADGPVDPAVVALLDAHNRERRSVQLGPLRLSAKLTEAAVVHARDMARHQTMDHTGSDGSKVVDRVKRVNYVYLRVGENIAEGQADIDEVMTVWMESPPHKANILGKFTELGAACIQDDRGVPYWCVDFGAPMPQLDPAEAAATALAEVNKARSADGEPRPKRTSDAVLGRAAMAISKGMASKDSAKLEVDAAKILSDQGVSGRELRMQFLSGVPTAEEAAKGLMGDDADVMDAFTLVGIGYAIGKSGTPYWCAIFGKPQQGRGPLGANKGGTGKSKGGRSKPRLTPE